MNWNMKHGKIILGGKGDQQDVILGPATGRPYTTPHDMLKTLLAMQAVAGVMVELAGDAGEQFGRPQYIDRWASVIADVTKGATVFEDAVCDVFDACGLDRRAVPRFLADRMQGKALWDIVKAQGADKAIEILQAAGWKPKDGD